MKSDKTEVFRGYLAGELKFRDVCKNLEDMGFNLQVDNGNKLIRCRMLPGLVLTTEKIGYNLGGVGIDEEIVQLILGNNGRCQAIMDATYLLTETLQCSMCSANQRP